MAVLQQQRQQQGGGGGSSKLSPSHLGGGGLPKQPMTGDPLAHAGGSGVSLADFHAKTQGMYSGKSHAVDKDQLLCSVTLSSKATMQ